MATRAQSKSSPSPSALDWLRDLRQLRPGELLLFAGPARSDKSLAAQAVARELGRDFLRVDLSALVSKYLGETEKHLSRLLDEAQAGGVVLLFDEADALFGKRSDVRDSHDRYSNLEATELLQRLAQHQGLVILATRRKSALDAAFLRRLRFVIDFPLPTVAERRRLWQHAFPPSAQLGSLDYAQLASAALDGDEIRRGALEAVVLAGRAGRPVTTALVLKAVQRWL